MTVLATVFAGLSSSEMTQAMFHRSLASQQQSKAGDQWAFFQPERLVHDPGYACRAIGIARGSVRLDPPKCLVTLERFQDVIISSTLQAQEKAKVLRDINS